jgi:hypothetical protein
MEKQVLGFRAAIKHKLLLLLKHFQVFNFVLLVNNVFISCRSGISIFGSKPGLPRCRTGTTPTQKGQETDYPFRKSSISCYSIVKFLEPFLSQFRAMKETNNKNSCCSQIQKYFHAAQKSLLLFCAKHRNKQKYFDAFSLLWDDTKKSNCPGRAGFTKARCMKSFSLFYQTIYDCYKRYNRFFFVVQINLYLT